MSPAQPACAWVDSGTRLLLKAVGTLTDDELDAPVALPGWTRRHLLAHLASNADALGNLLHWARTGIPTPMYTSPTQRADDIQTGARQPAGILRRRLSDSAAALSALTAALPTPAWDSPVVTAQGRTVPAGEVPWLRSREVYVHAVDLEAGVCFTDLPPEFSHTLLHEIAGKRSAQEGNPHIQLATEGRRYRVSGTGPLRTISLPLPEATAWMTGRLEAADLPVMPPWL
ncbi:maleylpyruvate isomerase family mycothiol-dependent enzyme [Streptomyces sp. NPDC055134]